MNGGSMTEKAWGRRAADMRLWATEVSDPYTRIEMIALADIYERRADRPGIASADEIRARPIMVSKLSRARCGRRIDPDWRLSGGRGYS